MNENEEVYTGPGYPIVLPREGAALCVLQLFEAQRKWTLNDMTEAMEEAGMNGRHIYGAIRMLRKKFNIPITTLRNKETGVCSYEATLPPRE